MDRLGYWFRLIGDHLGQHWKQHLIPLLTFLAGMMVFGWTLLLFYALVFGGTILMAALEQETLAMVAFFGFAALGS